MTTVKQITLEESNSIKTEAAQRKFAELMRIMVDMDQFSLYVGEQFAKVVTGTDFLSVKSYLRAFRLLAKDNNEKILEDEGTTDMVKWSNVNLDRYMDNLHIIRFVNLQIPAFN